MKQILIVATFAIFCTNAIAQYDDPKAATKKAQEDAWAAAMKAKAADEAAVAAQKKAEASKVPPDTKLEIKIYDGKGGKTISK